MQPASSRYLNRELSWLEFNQRVLEEAQDESIPVLERLKFLAITSTNLDEFFMVRVGGLKLLVRQGGTRPDVSGMSPAEQLDAVRHRTWTMSQDQYVCFAEQLEPKLDAAGIRRLAREALNDRQLQAVERVFENEISSVLTPVAVTSSDDVPLLAGRTLNVALRLAAEGTERYVVVPFGRALRRFVTLPSDRGYCYMLLEDAVALLADRFFPGEEVRECVPFRITRNADMSIREDQAADLLAEIEELLDARKESDCVRLEIAAAASPQLTEFLGGLLEVDPQDIIRVSGPLDLGAFMQLADLPGFDDLKYDAWPAQPSPEIDPHESMFQVLSRADVLLCHPYESFDPVVRLIEESARDPDVLAIKQTLYRTSRNSPIVAALQRAAELGKHVTAIVELKARFDEARNIEWARNLERADVQVIYGVKGLKTHAKVCIIVRREPQGIQRYVHFGTGNYNEVTARLYSDVSLLTCNEELGRDATSFFNAVTGNSDPQAFRKIDAAPMGLREKLVEMIDLETQRKRHGQAASIAAKVNSLVDPKIIDTLYAASQAGVKIRLNVRGVCCLRPGVEGLSDNITVVSIIDRFLEHARILYFYHGGDERVFLSSADWMPRNLDRRVELMVPVEQTACRRRLISILDTYLQDTTKARRLNPDGSYERVQPDGRRRPFRSQEELYRQAVEAVKQAQRSQKTVFVPHRAPGTVT